MKVLVTGAAGFIGYHTAQKLLARGDEVVGLDNLNDYYDVNLKYARLERLEAQDSFRFVRMDVADQDGMAAVFREGFDRVIHLAAQAGVRYSLENPHAYIDANVMGFMNILEGCRQAEVAHLVYASTSSVYGANTKMPFSEHEPADHPLAIYGATKRANELMAHSYAHLFALPCTGLRFFTVYGPWGRPDMALFKFTRAILEDQPIEVFNHGHHQRDFTFVEDIAEGVVRACDRPAEPNPDWDGDAPDAATSYAPWRLYNIGNNRPVQLMHYIEVLEQCLGKEARKEMLPLQPGDVPDTWANADDLVQGVGYRPETPVEEGVRRFVEWYREYYGV
ncbi:NAD-dependent epimerase [Sediminicurvatus halobius]|uniref:Capsular biosynthesis protein CpsI n=1 Tax=Sediminicurvatus halobius TaxID=2182432 RepID=A0A2U2N136_9GAMM|nr:NAD-dependent epimerase [Spiribacter halobius]PWG62955.1 capsular biosynthesis protein CpsI [Spiribacter halobius]UEX77469.1 NAD-dependent epimerase [Spiribacter halobius]